MKLMCTHTESKEGLHSLLMLEIIFSQILELMLLSKNDFFRETFLCLRAIVELLLSTLVMCI